MTERLVQYRKPSGEIHGIWYKDDVVAPDVVDGMARIKPPMAVSRKSGVIEDARPVVSSSSPRWHGRGSPSGEFYKNHTANGKPVIASRAALRDAQARAADVGETITRARDYDGND